MSSAHEGLSWMSRILNNQKNRNHGSTEKHMTKEVRRKADFHRIAEEGSCYNKVQSKKGQQLSNVIKRLVVWGSVQKKFTYLKKDWGCMPADVIESMMKWLLRKLWKEWICNHLHVQLCEFLTVCFIYYLHRWISDLKVQILCYSLMSSNQKNG